MRKLLLFSFLSLLVISSQGWSDTVSLEANYVEGQTDLVTKLNNDRTALTNGINNIRGAYAGSQQSAGQIRLDTIGESNMYDDANPRIRTNESASCPDVVYSGLLPSTTVGTGNSISSISAGVAYPDGFRVEKTTSTPKEFTVNKWTWVYLLTSGSFDYQEQTIDGSTPAQPANSAVLARVSTNATEVVSVVDLRKTSCAAGPFSAIADTSTGASLGDLFSKGIPNRRYTHAGKTPAGWVQGLFVSYETTNTFLVTSGGAYINGEYRILSDDVSVTTSTDGPTTGDSGIDTGSLAANTRYYVYGVADQEDVNTMSVSFSTNASAPAGVTNSRLLGAIRTSDDSVFVSTDV